MKTKGAGSMIQLYKGEGFWKRPTSYKPGKRLTENAIHQIENLLDVELPLMYKKLMNEQNGGELTYRYLLFEDGEAAIIPYFQELDAECGVGLSSVFIEQLHLPERQVLLTGTMDTWLSLDYRYTTVPKVVYFSANEDGSWSEEVAAQSFDEFLGKLFLKENDD